jgi:hypothetical protein
MRMGLLYMYESEVGDLHEVMRGYLEDSWMDRVSSEGTFSLSSKVVKGSIPHYQFQR